MKYNLQKFAFSQYEILQISRGSDTFLVYVSSITFDDATTTAAAAAAVTGWRDERTRKVANGISFISPPLSSLLR